MNKKSVIIITLVFVTIVLLAFLFSTLLLKEKPTLRSKATELSCPLDSGSCSWSSDDSATSFEVRIIDKTTGVTILEKTTSVKNVKFTPVGGHIYECSVVPVNSCGKGPEVKDSKTCLLITGTPPPTPTTTITPEISVTPSGTITLSPTPTEQIIPSPTPTENLTGTPAPSETPTPSDIPTPTNTVTPTPSPTRTPTPNPSATVTAPPGTSNTPTEIILVKTTEGATVQPATSGLPTVGTVTGWLLVSIPLVLIILAFVF